MLAHPRAPHKRIAQRNTEIGNLYFEHISFFGLDAIGKGKCRRSEHVDMNVTRLPKKIVFEVMVFEIGEGVRHVVFARQEFFLEYDGVATSDPGHASHIIGSGAQALDALAH